MDRRILKTLATGLLLLLLVLSLPSCDPRALAPDDCAEFPISIYPDALYVPVTIGASEHLCELDSGAGGYVFHTTLRDTLGASIGHAPISSIDGSISRAEIFKVPDARVGSITLNKNAQTLCYDLSSIREVSGRDIEGLIGLPLFQSYIVQLDFDAHRIAICSPSISPKSTWGEPIRLAFNKDKLPTVVVDFGDGIAEQCIVDTGFTSPIWLSSNLYTNLLSKKRIFAGGKVPMALVTGNRMVREGSVRDIKIGSIVTHNDAVREGGAESRIGLGYLRQFRVTIDIPHDRLYLAKGQEFDKPGKQRAVGIGLLRKNEKTVVTWIEPDSPAKDAGISVDDELVSIAGEPIAERPLEEIRSMLDEKADPSGNLKLMFRRGSKERIVELTIRDPAQVSKEETPAIAEIKRLGGKVWFDEELPGKPVYAVDFSHPRVGNDALLCLEPFTELKVLILADTQVTDAGLKHIEEHTKLRALVLYHTRVTDAGLEHIKALVHLRTLDVSDTQVTDAGLKQISGLPKLFSLSVDNTQITDEGLKHLKGLKHLERLYTRGTKVTPAGWNELKQALPRLN